MINSTVAEKKEWQCILQMHKKLISALLKKESHEKIETLRRQVDERTWFFLARKIPFLPILPEPVITLGKLLIGERLDKIEHKRAIVDDIHGFRKEVSSKFEIEADNAIFQQDISDLEKEIAVLQALYTSHEAQTIWEEVCLCEEKKHNAIPIALHNAFHGWKNRVKATKSAQRNNLLQAAKCLKKLVKILDKDVYAQQVCNDIFWHSIAEKFSKTAKFWEQGNFGKDMSAKVQLLNSFCREVEVQEKMDQQLSANFPEARNVGEGGIMIGLLNFSDLIESVIANIQKSSDDFLYPKSDSFFPTKETSAEKIYFTRMLGDGVKQTFGKSRPSIIVKLLPLINPNWDDDESLVSKNLKMND